MKRIVWSLVVLALAAVVINDGGRYLRSYSDLNMGTNDLASWAATNARDMSPQQAFAALAQQAEPAGISVVRYDSDGERLQVWTEKNVDGTWVLDTITAMRHGVSFQEARNTPLVVHRNVEATFQ
ncbi:MAG: hypothetical protein AB2L09_13180 [Coriobacteriia bacterium]